MIVLIKNTATHLYTAPQLFGENSEECEPGPSYYGAVQRTSQILTGISKGAFVFFFFHFTT